VCCQCVFVGAEEQPKTNQVGGVHFFNEINEHKKTVLFFGV
jgi:hypothetical protein